MPPASPRKPLEKDDSHTWITRILKADEDLPHEVAWRAAGFIASREHKAGGFFTIADGECYHFDGHDHRLRRMLDGRGISPEFGAVLFHRYGLPYTLPVTRNIVSGLEMEARRAPNPPMVRRFSFYDRGKNILYLSRYNGTVYRLTGSKIEIIPNGKEVLFLDDDSGLTVEADIGNHGLLQKMLIDDLNYCTDTAGGLTPAMQKALLHTWLFGVAFNEALRARPILILVGEKGSGKTFTLKRIQQTILGEAMPLMLPRSANEEDLAVSLQSYRITILDNVDSFIEWLPDAIAAYTTGAGWSKRKRYTDNVQVKMNPQSFVAVTSRNPTSFYRDDVADRLLIMRLGRRTSFTSETVIFDELQALRPKLYGEWLWNLNKLVKVLSSTKDKAQTTRLADYGAFVTAAGKYLGYAPEVLDQALLKQQAEREEFSIENESMIELLERWLRDYPKEQTVPYTATDLYSALSKYAVMKELPWEIRSSTAFGIRLAQKWDALQRRIVGTKTLSAGRTRYSFVLRS